MSDESIGTLKSQILDLFSDLNPDELNILEQWLCTQSYKKDLEKKKELKKVDNLLVMIGDSLKKIVPFKAEMPSEKIVPPTVGDQADCNENNTIHVDEFLYDDVQIGELYKQGKIKKHYCMDCKSHNIGELIVISHSMSRKTVQYIFNVLLPSDLTGQQVLDVGSRLGAVLYGAYYISNASSIIGIEMNLDCCVTQNKIIEEFSLDTKRLQVVHSDVMLRGDIVKNSNVVIINVLDFFVDNEKHKEMWHFFKKHLTKDTYLVTNRSMVETLDALSLIEELNLRNWLKICKVCQVENEIFFDMEDFNEIFLYIVK